MLDSLFEEKLQKTQLTQLPLSVIEIGPQGRRTSNATQQSSRSEYSPFPVEVSDICFEYFLRNQENIFDPFAGWGDRAVKAKQWDKKYTGFDCSQEAIDYAKARGCENILANSAFDEIPVHDGLITCPPYWNLEVYAGHGIDKLRTWEEFKSEYAEIWKRVWAKAEKGSVYCIMVGEWRHDHKFYDLEGVTRRIFDDLGATLFDQVVVSRKKVTKINILLPQAKRLGYTVRLHESLLVYVK